MAGQGIEFNIDARDQASKVLNTVNKKIQDFGKDVGKSIVSVVGPMALAGTAVSKITEYFDEMKRKAEEAFNWGAGLKDSAEKLGVTAEEFQKITYAADETGQSVDKVAKAFKLASDLILSARAGSKDAAAALEAMGFSAAELSDMKPEDVLMAIASAMAAVEDPTVKAQVAMAALGKSAKDLQDTLAKGFDIAGAMTSTAGLSDEEANQLRLMKREEERKKNKEMLERSRLALVETPEGRQALIEARKQVDIYSPEMAQLLGVNEEVVKSPAFQRNLQRILAEKQRKEDEARKLVNPPNPAVAEALRVRAENEDKKEKEVAARAAKDPKGAKVGGVSNEPLGSISVKTPPLTVSSLREVGGALAGETVMNMSDYMQITIDIQKSMLKELEMFNNRSRDTIDFTKFPTVNPLLPSRTLV